MAAGAENIREMEQPEREMTMSRKWIAVLMTGSLLTGAGGTYAGMQWLAKETPQAEAPNQLIDSKDGKQIEQEKIEKDGNGLSS